MDSITKYDSNLDIKSICYNATRHRRLKNLAWLLYVSILASFCFGDDPIEAYLLSSSLRFRRLFASCVVDELKILEAKCRIYNRELAIPL